MWWSAYAVDSGCCAVHRSQNYLVLTLMSEMRERMTASTLQIIACTALCALRIHLRCAGKQEATGVRCYNVYHSRWQYQTYTQSYLRPLEQLLSARLAALQYRYYCELRIGLRIGFCL
jgi:hypothetical protein